MALITPLAAEDWQLAESPKPSALIVQLRRRTYVLPYFRFLYAEGDDAEVKIWFSSHMITITGTGLAALLTAVATNVVFRIMQPTENEANFSVRGTGSARYSGPSIDQISVEASPK